MSSEPRYLTLGESFTLSTLSAILALIVFENVVKAPAPSVAKAEATSKRAANKQFPGPWVEGLLPSLEGMRLITREIQGCAYLKFRPSVTNPGVYYVRCSRDQVAWHDYLVWANINRVRPLVDVCRSASDDEMARARASGNAQLLAEVQESARRWAAYQYEYCL